MSTICLFQTELQREPEQQEDAEVADREPQQRYCCAVCAAYVSDDRYKILINQQHCHSRSNPDNQLFSFCCFSTAPGCQAHGTATEEHSWFSGYRWRFAHCKNCGTQLGWQFVGEQTFFALVQEQLVDCEAD